MEKRIKFSISDNLKVTEKTIEYFKKLGFNQLSTNEEKLIFKRGSIALNMLTSNPFKWKSTVEIEIIGQEIMAEYKINTIGHIPTRKDEKRWDSFIANYKGFMTEKNYDLKTENEKLTKNSLTDYIGWTGIIGFLIGFSGRYIADLTGIYWIIIVLVAAGLYVLLTKVIIDRKRIKTPYNMV